MSEPYAYTDPVIDQLVTEYRADMAVLIADHRVRCQRSRTNVSLEQVTEAVTEAFRKIGEGLRDAVSPQRNTRGQFTKAH